jgi:hypothetical protein
MLAASGKGHQWCLNYLTANCSHGELSSASQQLGLDVSEEQAGLLALASHSAFRGDTRRCFSDDAFSRCLRRYLVSAV